MDLPMNCLGQETLTGAPPSARFQYFLKTWFNQTFCRHGITGREKEKSEWCDKHCHSTKKKNDGKQQGKADPCYSQSDRCFKNYGKSHIKP